MAFDFPNTSSLPDGYRVRNTDTFSEYAWQVDPGKWVLVDPVPMSDLFVTKIGDTMTGPLLLTDDPVLGDPAVIGANPAQAVHKDYADTTFRSIVTELRTAVSDSTTFEELKTNLTEALNELAGDADPSSY